MQKRKLHLEAVWTFVGREILGSVDFREGPQARIDLGATERLVDLQPDLRL